MSVLLEAFYDTPYQRVGTHVDLCRGHNLWFPTIRYGVHDVTTTGTTQTSKVQVILWPALLSLHAHDILPRVGYLSLVNREEVVRRQVGCTRLVFLRSETYHTKMELNFPLLTTPLYLWTRISFEISFYPIDATGYCSS